MKENMTNIKPAQEAPKEKEIKIKEAKEAAKNILKKTREEKDKELLVNQILESSSSLSAMEIEKILGEFEELLNDEEKIVAKMTINAAYIARDAFDAIKNKPIRMRAKTNPITTEVATNEALKELQIKGSELSGPSFQKLKMMIKENGLDKELNIIMQNLLINKLTGYKGGNEGLKLLGYSQQDVYIYLTKIKKENDIQAKKIINSIWPENKKKETETDFTYRWDWTRMAMNGMEQETIKKTFNAMEKNLMKNPRLRGELYYEAMKIAIDRIKIGGSNNEKDIIKQVDEAAKKVTEI